MVLAVAHMSSAADDYDGYYIPKGTIIMGNGWYGPDMLTRAMIIERLSTGQSSTTQRSSQTHSHITPTGISKTARSILPFVIRA
jgi:hypothetical protein